MATDLWAPRPVFTQDHQDYRHTVATFVERVVAPAHEAWDSAGIVPRAPWLEAGRQGLLGIGVAEADGGPGLLDAAYRMIIAEEFAKLGANALAAGIGTQNDIVLPYVIDLATSEQRERWLPGLCSGVLIGAIGMTEPGTGSDLQAIRTTAVRDGSDWVVNGTKMFITNGINADVIIVVCRTDPGAGSHGFSLLVVERGMPGFERGRKLDKIGMPGQDTAELIFRDVRVPAANVLGEIGGGLPALMNHLPLERMSIAIAACAGIRAALTWTVDYTKTRTAFGTPIAGFQNTQFALAEMVTELDMAQAWTDQAIGRLDAGTLSAVDAAKGKWFCSELHKRVVDRCLQFFGGYGYMREYPIARAYTDVRVSTIYGGTTEIMKLIIARDLIGR